MDKLNIKIDGLSVQAEKGQTILQAAEVNGIHIPTLCYDERTEVYGGCGICIVEVVGMPKLMKACSTELRDGMEIFTATDRVLALRKTNLELLLSNHTGDCRPPCMQGCPANTDCQGYVGLVANGENEEALKLIKDRIPLPASIGRVCPHPCEDKCRRGLVDKPIAIAEIKRYAADKNLLEVEKPFVPEIMPETGKRVAVIGGGPYGLSMAYFLRQRGHSVTLFDAMPKLGGMLRYGIPQYRLPKEILDQEIDIIEKMGVIFKCPVRIGPADSRQEPCGEIAKPGRTADSEKKGMRSCEEVISFEEIRSSFDAVCIGVGAWKSSPVGCKGEKADGVLGGIDFLRKVALGQESGMGKKVAVIGGGNTAMDACRTAVRLGAEQVYNVYRRTVEEMPAVSIEIEEAQEEGVILKNLAAPEEIITDETGRVCKIKLQVMELGEVGADGRRKPVPVLGKFVELEVDTVIGAIGQAVEGELFPGIEVTRKNGLKYDETTFRTNIEGVFAGGDCGNDKISIGVEAIADAQKSWEIVDAYLKGESISYRKEFTVERNDLTEESFEDRERMFRQQAFVMDENERKHNFEEVAATFTDQQAQAEASRCLECGCQDYFECKLISYSNQMGIDRLRFEGDKTDVEDKHFEGICETADGTVEKSCCDSEVGKEACCDENSGTSEACENCCDADAAEDDLFEEAPYIIRDNKKCILCGACVRVCDELVGAGAIGLMDRGFDTTVEPELCKNLEDTDCIACGQCIAVCPTGALREGRTDGKPIPLKTERVKTICGFCPIGCEVYKEVYGDKVIRIVPDLKCGYNGGLICSVGKFGYLDLLSVEDDVENSCDDGGQCDGEVIDIEGDTITQLIENIAEAMGTDAVLGIFDNATNEEIAEAKAVCKRLDMRLVGVRDDYKDEDPHFRRAVELINVRRKKKGLPEYAETELMKGCNAAGLKAAGIEYGEEYEADIILPYGNWLERKGTTINIDGLELRF